MSTMKKSLMILGAVCAIGAKAQNSSVVSAFNYLQDGDLAKAVEYIEPAITNEGTSVKEKTWRYRGDIYRSIAFSDKADLKAQFPDAMKKSIESYLKANELDTKGAYKDENVAHLGALQVMALNSGNDAFAAKNYDQAIALYDESERIAKAFNMVDSNAVSNSALAYESKGDKTKAIERYKERIAMGNTKPDMYRSVASLYHGMKDLPNAITITQDGRKAFPANKELMVDEVAFLLEANRMEEAETSLKNAIAQDPNNAVLYSVLGSLYDGKANPKEGPPPAEADMKKYYELAEQAYKSSIEKDPKFFDSYFNIGVLYNNRAAFEYEKIKNIKDDAQYTKAKKVADDIYLKAVPFFEKAHELKPDDKQTTRLLKVLYAKAGNTAKFEEMKKLLGE